MDGNEAKRRQRRDLLGASLALPVLIAAGVPLSARAAPTPACGDDGKPTPRQMEGPFYTPNTPRRMSLLEPGLRGTRLQLTGRVLSTDCTPLPGVLLDFWQIGGPQTLLTFKDVFLVPEPNIPVLLLFACVGLRVFPRMRPMLRQQMSVF